MTAAAVIYSSVNTKAKALFGKLLTKKDYDELLEKRTVQDVAAFLKKSTSYSKLLSEINENLVHRGELEKLFNTSLYGDFIKLTHFMSGKQKEFLKAAFLRYEAEDLKLLFRMVYTHHGDISDKNAFIFLKKYSRLDYKKLMDSDSVYEIISTLKESEYYKVLAPFLDSSKQLSLFDMEMSLDLHFLMTILKLKAKLLAGADYESITKTFGIEVDILNILMIFRCKKLFRFPAELTYKYVVPYWFRLTREQLVQLSQSPDVEDFKRILNRTRYNNLFKADEEHLWEQNSMKYMNKIFKSNMRRNSFNIGTVFAYLHLKETDIKNIITLIEGVRYNLPKEEIQSYLVV